MIPNPEITVLKTLATQHGHTRFDLRTTVVPGLTQDELMQVLQALETKGYLHLPEGATCWLTSAGIKEADPWGERTPKTAAVEPLYALHFVNKADGIKCRIPAMDPGPKEDMEAKAQQVINRSDLKEPDAKWTIQALPVEESTPVTAAVTYIPSEDDVDPDTLAEGKGKEDIEARDQRDDNAGDRAGIHTSALEPTPFRAESPRRPTREEIRSKANDHVGYGWTKRPGSWDPNIHWTDEDVATYGQDYDELLANARAANPPNFSAGHIRDFGAGGRMAPKTGAPKVTAVRCLQANSLVVLYGGQKVAHWEGATLEAALEDGTLNPRHVEASAIEFARNAGLLNDSTPEV